MSRLLRRARRAALIALLAGCGAQSFQPQFQTPKAPTEPVVLEQVSTTKPRDERPVAVGLTTEPARLFAWDLSAGLLWERPVRPKSAPLVVADAIVMHEAAGITVRDLASGEVRAVVDEEGRLVGADGHGHAVVIAIAYEGGAGGEPRSAVAYVEGSQLRWKQSLQLPVGVPSLVNGRVLVPWATQRLSVLDTKDGAELVRWHMNNTVLGLTRVDRGRVYAGQLGLMRVDAQLLSPAVPPIVYSPLKRSLPGQPPLLRDGYAPVPEPESAHHRLQLDWRIGTGDTPTTTENDLLALRFYRLLFALDAQSDAVRWVRVFDHDLVGAAIEPGGLFVADSSGVLRFLDVAGNTRITRDLGRPLQVIAIRPGGWVPLPAPAAAPAAATPPTPAPPAATPAAAAPAAATPAAPTSSPAWAVAPLEAPLPSLREQLFAAAALEDDRLGAGRAYAVERMATLPDESVTAHLVQLCAERSPPPVQLAACTHLAQRGNGGDQVVLALRRSASFLSGADAPPVGALARAAAQMKLKQAAPLLVSHVDDPNTPASDLVAVFETLVQLGHRPAASAIERFVRMHHAEPEGSELAPALFAGMHALGSLRARAARGSLEDISRDPLAPEGVRGKAREAIAMLEAPAAVAPKDAGKSEPEPEEGADERDEVQTDPRPYSVTAELARTALRPVRAPLSKCVAADPAKPRNARVSMVVNGDGRVEGVFVTPTTLQACIEAPLHEVRFPQTRLGRQRITHVVYGANASEDASTKPSKTRPAPRKAKRAPPARPAAGKK